MFGTIPVNIPYRALSLITLNSSSSPPRLPLIQKAFASPNTEKKLFLWLSALDNEILSTSKIRTFLV